MDPKQVKSFLLPFDFEVLLENPRKLTNDRCTDSFLFTGFDAYDNKLLLLLVRKKNTIRTYVYLRLGYEQIYYGSEDHFVNHFSWLSKCIKLECCEPMKTWRLCYNGLLRKFGATEEYDHIKLNFLWHPISSTVFYDKTGIPSFECNIQSEESIYNLLQGYEQWGTLHGIVQINQQELELNLTSLKKRSWSMYKIDSVTLTTSANNGMLININSIINCSVGHARTLKKHFCISECDFLYPSKAVSQILFQLTDGKHWYRVITKVFSESAVRLGNLQIFNVMINIDGCVNGEGLLLFFKRHKKCDVEPNYILPLIHPSTQLMVDLESDESQDSSLVGEKAATLSKINFLLRNYYENQPMNKIRVPSGICVTVNAMDVCIRDNEDLKYSLNMLKYGLHEVPSSQLKVLCEKIQKSWILARVDYEVINYIEYNTSKEKQYAVRSSGIHEDTPEVSAAGQSGTYLRIQGISDIILSLKKCWASVYSFESVQYRRDQGLPLYVEMGVIIQEMVTPEMNGVLFTCHPIINDPRIISITYSYVDNATKDDTPSTTVLIDKKSLQIKETIHNSQENTHPLLEEIRQTLCKICRNLEDLFSYTIDVEWGIFHGIVYLFQCRPVTTIFTWTDFEISHELDSGFTDFDAITFHNCGEIVVDVTSPLSITFNNRIMEDSFKLLVVDSSTKYHKKLLAISQFRIAVNICNGLLLHVDKEIPFIQKIIDVIICGQVITNDALYLLAQKRNGITSSFSTLSNAVTSLKLILNRDKCTEKAIKIADEFKINVDEFNCAESLLQYITDQVVVLKKVAEYHLNVSSASNILKATVLSLMCKNDEENLQHHVTNLSWYLSNYEDLVSADVPKSLSEIARILRQNDRKDDYLSVPIRDKYNWMEEHCPEAWSKMKIFFNRHGSRSVKEADLMTETWSMNSDPIFECIDLLVKSDKSELSQTRQENLAASQNYSRTVKWMLSLCKNAVISREKTKQCLILILHQFRLAFRKLSALLIEDVIVSNEKFIFYYTFYELHQLVRGTQRRSILHKGQRRYRLWNHLRCLKFDDVIFGLPHPVETISQETSEDISRLHGTSVSFHSTIGRAFVCSDINEAKLLQDGDILITRCIDIGWSPYFPLLSGVITELGGLMSHGAIIARECGLSCIIGVKNVTSSINTGDRIEMNGPTGVITRLQVRRNT